MRIKKAVITAAGQSQRALPLQTLIDRDGQEKSVLSILIEQALAANVEEICVVVWPGDEARYADAAGRTPAASASSRSPSRAGYGNAILCAREFTGADPFLHLVGDHLYVSAGDRALHAAPGGTRRSAECSVSGVQPTRESLLPRFGTVGGRRVAGRSDLYRIDTVIEKPTPTEAEQRLMVPGIRAGYYLCFFGMHVLTPARDGTPRHKRRAATLSAALADLARHEQYLALEDEGRRYDLGARYGLLVAQLALALNGQDRARCSRSCSNCWPIANCAPPREEAASEPAHRRDHRERRSSATARSTPLCRDLSLEELLAECAGARPLPPHQRQPLRARARAVLPLRHPPLPPARCARRCRRARRFPFAGYTNLLKRRFEEAIDLFLARRREHGPSAAISSALAAAYQRSASRRWPTRCAAACAACAATSGCSAPAIPPIIRCASAPNCCARRGRSSSRSCAKPRRCAWT